MDDKLIEMQDVFKDSGVPEHNFVQSSEYFATKIALRTKGKRLVIEGPSGIGKTSCIQSILKEENIRIIVLSARNNDSVELIKLFISDPKDAGLVIIDDFHHLSNEDKTALTNILKLGADETRQDFKLVLVGINQAGDSLVALEPEINNRIDTIKFENNAPYKVRELIDKGEAVLNISIADKDAIVDKAYGSFHIAQMLCKKICIDNEIGEQQADHKTLPTPCDDVVRSQVDTLYRRFGNLVKDFARGNKFRRSNHTYLNLLKFLAWSEDGVVSIRDICNQHPKLRSSLTQITTKEYIQKLIERYPDLKNNFFYDSVSMSLTVEDPKLMFYLKNLNWDKLEKECGFVAPDNKQYSYALSFAGEMRGVAFAIKNGLEENEVSVFYDEDHQADLVGADIDAYLGPIYASDSKYVVVILDSNYPRKVWTCFESDKYKERFSENAIIPILVDGFAIDPLSPFSQKGNFMIYSSKDINEQVEHIVEILTQKLEGE